MHKGPQTHHVAPNRDGRIASGGRHSGDPHPPKG